MKGVKDVREVEISVVLFGGQKSAISVLSSFSLRKFADIQDFISARQSNRGFRDVILSGLSGM